MQVTIRLTLLITLFLFLSCQNQKEKQEEAETEHTHDLAYLQQEAAKYPDSLLLHQDLIEAYRNNGNYDSAITVTQRQIDRDTGNAYLWNIMATLHYEMGDTSGTIHSLQKAITIYPLPDYYVALATVYAEQANDTALIISDALLDQPEPNNYKDDAYFIKGLYYNYKREPQNAIPALDSAIALNYTYMYAYREKAIALYDLKKYKTAVTVLRRAVTLQNAFDEGYYWLGRNYEKLNYTDSAIQSYQNALLYDKNYTEAREALDRLTKKSK